MNKLTTLALMISLITTCRPSVALAADSFQSTNIPISAAVGKAFTITLKDNAECSALKPLSDIDLVINGMDTGLHPLSCDPTNKKLTFVIKRDLATKSAVSNEAWQAMLASPWDTAKNDFKRDLDYTVTQPANNDADQNISNGKLRLLIANLTFASFGAVLVAVLWSALLYLGRKSGMLRDDGNQGGTLQSRTYSLGRVQMAWWFGIIMGSYIFIWMMSQDIPAIGSQALLLMGISGATALSAVGLNAGMNKPLPASDGFWDDLLTDAYGVTLHRFQMVAVTVILGVMFVIHVATTLTMPEFDGSLLTLMGISGGAYLGFKIPETQVADATQSNASAPIIEEHKAGYSPEPESAANK